MFPTQILLAQPRGFCAGVTRAIEIVERALSQHGAPIYVFHKIAHNQWVVNDLRARGAVFVDSIDATCPLVSKVHQQAQRFVRMGHVQVMIGHAGHEEVQGSIGRVNTPVYLVSSVADAQALRLPADAPVAYVTQTTLSLDDTRDIIDALAQRLVNLVGPNVDHICYATQNRQVAVRALAAQVDLVLVVEARNSSNSNRLREVAERAGVPAHLVQDATEIRGEWFSDAARIGVTSGASTPDWLVQQVVHSLQSRHNGPVTPVLQLPGIQEDVRFCLPGEISEPVN